tara:strand:- start:258 stop:794 length:537 start_codon:yes stop_codon:yes gene_type:complete
MINITLEGDKTLQAKMDKFIDNVNNKKKIIREVMTPAAKIVTKVMRSKAPVLRGGTFDVYRTPKMKSGKAPKGMGKIYVKIKPNQLKKSIFHFHTRATRKAGAINIGPRYKSGVWKKPEKGGWYMHMVQFGTDLVKAQPFVKQALIASSKGVGNMMKKGYLKLMKDAAKQSSGYIQVK